MNVTRFEAPRSRGNAFSFQNWKPYKDQVWPMEGAMNVNLEIPFQNDLVVRSDTNLSHLTGTPSWFECRQIPLRRWRTQRSRRCDLHVKGRPNPECINMKMRLSNDDDLKVVMKSLEERVTLSISQAWDMFHNDWLIVLMSWKDPLLAKLEQDPCNLHILQRCKFDSEPRSVLRLGNWPTWVPECEGSDTLWDRNGNL